MNSHAIEERERIVGDEHQIHAEQKQRVGRQHPERFGLLAAVADRVEADNARGTIDDHREHDGQRIEPEPGAEAGKADGKRQGLRQRAHRYINRGGCPRGRNQGRQGIEHLAATRRASQRNRRRGQGQPCASEEPGVEGETHGWSAGDQFSASIVASADAAAGSSSLAPPYRTRRLRSPKPLLSHRFSGSQDKPPLRLRAQPAADTRLSRH